MSQATFAPQFVEAWGKLSEQFNKIDAALQGGEYAPKAAQTAEDPGDTENLTEEQEALVEISAGTAALQKVEQYLQQIFP